MDKLKDLKILEMVHTDAAQVKEITLNLNLSRWSKIDYEQELEKNDCIAIVGKINEKIVGFIVARLIMSCNTDPFKFTVQKTHKIDADVDIEIYNLGVIEQFQRRGIGQKLLNNLCVGAAEYKSAKIWLEVRESNTKAIDFYTANNFEIRHQRKNFYTDPPENALVMKLDINQFWEGTSKNPNLPLKPIVE